MAYCDTLIIKIASRCNINCTYCYMYNLGDTSWKMQPKFISEETIKNSTERIREHCLKHDVKSFKFILHGGEPLLMSKQKFSEMLDVFDTLKEDGIKINYSLQTNGILIDEEWCDIFNKYNIGVGISIDGPEDINDSHRQDKKGRGTYKQVIDGIKESEKYMKRGLGILSVQNLELDPITAYYHTKGLPHVRTGDFLLLNMNYDTYEDENYNIEGAPAADWYIKMFDEWFYDKEVNTLQIRFFEVIMHRILGGIYSIDNIGTGKNSVLILETNGGFEAVDVLKICGESFTKDIHNINTHSFDDALQAKLTEVYYHSGEYLAKKCLACPVKDVCGGGYLPHRYSSKNGFNNSSVYCNDLLKLITHIQNTIVENLPKDVLEKSGIEFLTYENAQQIIQDNLPLIEEPHYAEKLESFKAVEDAVEA